MAVAVGGVAGAEARYGLEVAWPHPAGQFPWTTLLINVLGCLLIGVLLGALARAPRPPRLARPLLGTGVLGGFTTFSAYAVDVAGLGHAGRWAVAAAYLVLTVVACVAATAVGLVVVRR